MPRADRRHIDDVPVDEFDSQLGRQHAGGTEALIFISRQTVPLQRRRQQIEYIHGRKVYPASTAETLAQGLA